jgi:hypothetical protein
VPSTVAFSFAEVTGRPAGSSAPISTYQVLVSAVSQADATKALDAPSATGSVALLEPGNKLQSDSGAGQAGSSGTGAVAERLLVAEGGGTTLTAGAVGSWANCTTPCTYEVSRQGGCSALLCSALLCSALLCSALAA